MSLGSQLPVKVGMSSGMEKTSLQKISMGVVSSHS